MFPPPDTPASAPGLVTPAVKRVLDWHLEHDKPPGAAPELDGDPTPTEQGPAKERGKNGRGDSEEAGPSL